MSSQRSKLELLIEKKETAQKQLESELSQTKAENESKQEEAKKVKQDMLDNFTDLLETELKCSICSELFIKVSIIGTL